MIHNTLTNSKERLQTLEHALLEPSSEKAVIRSHVASLRWGFNSIITVGVGDFIAPQANPVENVSLNFLYRLLLYIRLISTFLTGQIYTFPNFLKTFLPF